MAHLNKRGRRKTSFDFLAFVGVTDKASTGVAPITVNASGENSIVIISGANMLLTEEDVKAAKDVITSASVVVCQLEIKPEVTQLALSIAKKAGVITIFNPAPAQSWLDTMFYKDSDVFCANETEAEILTGVPISCVEDAFYALPVLLDRGAAKVVITLGENGSVVATREDPTPRHVPSKEVKPLDTTGAGDAFVGALAFYLSKYKGLTFAEMVRRANEIAAISVCGPGTQTSYPTVAKLPPALFDPPGVNSCPQRSPKPDTTIVHHRSKSEERRRRISLPNDNLTSRDGKPRNVNESPPKGQRRSSNDDAPSGTKKSRGFFGRRRSEGSVGSRKQIAEQSKSNGKVTKGEDGGNTERKEDVCGRRGSIPQIQGVALAGVETVGRETMIDF
ncbi:ribokinase [Paramuricea clavata]|uniref:Ribokinase n=2 Tax=Paramuricea clavata TaxID=317549 RepID=A0A7D9DQ54_PARCT|nr:ribokinase [Paramuricea clavata]